jgi:hypothetical protein
MIIGCELKLQKQLDYLRTNHDCMLVHTDNSVIFENSVYLSSQGILRENTQFQQRMYSNHF